MSETNEKWSNLEETAEYLGVTKDTIRNWIKMSQSNIYINQRLMILS